MNDTQRLLLAVVLTFVVVFVWSYLFTPKTPHKTQKALETQKPKEKQEVSRPVEKVSEESFKTKKVFLNTLKESPKVVVETPLYKAVFCVQGAVLEEFVLKKYKESVKPNSPSVKLINGSVLNFAPLGIVLNNKNLWGREFNWSCDKRNLVLKDGEDGELTFKAKGGGIDVIRKFVFKGDSYSIEEELKIMGKEQKNRITLSLVLASTPLVEHTSRFNKTHLIYYRSKLYKEDSIKKLKEGISSEGEAFWAGIDSNYFLIAAVPTKGASFGFFGKYEDNNYLAYLNTSFVLSKNPKVVDFYYYLGPKLESFLKDAPKNLYAAINYGWFDIIAKPLVKVLNFFYRFVGNYGIAIILLTLVIKIIFWPLSHKSYKSMEKMKKIQPLLKKIKEQYKDDRQKMNQELMRLYRTYKINPASGCLPMLLQIPVFIGLYEALLGATELRHAPFITHIPFTNIIWLADLSAKDPLYISPIVMGITMYLQQKLSPSSGDPMQSKIMLIMPIFLTFLFLNFPSGLVIYFITNNVLSTIQQWWMLRKS